MANYDVTTAGSALEFDTTSFNVGAAKPLPIDSNHFIVFYAGEGSDGYAEVLTINTSTWAVTTAAASLEFDTDNGQYNSALKIDSNHFINFYGGSGSDGYAEVFAVDTSTWAVTTTATRKEFDTNNGLHNSACQIDTNHFINFWTGAAATTDSRAQVFTVNTTTWAVTTAADLLQFDTDTGSFNNAYKIDTNHFINFWSGTDNDGFVQVFTVNTPFSICMAISGHEHRWFIRWVRSSVRSQYYNLGSDNGG